MACEQVLVRLHTRLNMLAAKDSTPVTSGERETTTTEIEKSSTTSMPQPSGLGELATTAAASAGRGQGAVQRVQVGSAPGADKSEMSRERANQKLSPTPATRPMKYALEIWVELEVSPGVYGTPEDDSYGTDFVVETLNQAYPGCTGLYLDVAGHMVAFYGKKSHPKAGLLQEQGIQASQAIATIPTWMGYPATWRARCVSVTEASKIVTACKRLERENWRRARWELQHRFPTMRLGSALSAVAKPFQPQAALSSTLVASPPQGPVDPAGPRESSPATAAIGTPAHRGSPVSYHASDEGETSPDTSILDSTSRRRHARRGNRSRYSSSDSDDSHASALRRKKKDGFSNKIQIPEFGGKKGHPQDVASVFRQWARCITYYRDYYEDSYLMPLMVSSLTGDASDVFDWTQSLTPGDPQDLSTLLQMLREHYCGSFTFCEQRNMVQNLRQGAQEDATDFMIRVGTSVSNLDKDWRGQLSQAELESLQYEVSLNGVRQEIRHILDSEIARRGPLTPHQMYEAVKKYEMYVARNKRLEGQGSSPSTGQQKTAGQTSNYKPHFHKTTAFAAKVEESEAQVESPSARSSRASNKPLQVKGTPYLNPDPFCRFIGPKNWGEALIDDKLMTCLLDKGSQLNFVTPTYAHERGMDILSLDTLAQEIGGQLPPIAIMGGGMIKPEGFVIMNVQVPCVRGYNEDQIAIVLEDPEMKDCPVVLGTPTLFRVMEVIKESEISKLAVPWASSRLSWLMRGVHAKMSRLQVKDVANKPIAPLSVDEVVRVTSKCMVPPFGHKVIHSHVGLVLQGYKMNVMTHGLEKRSPLLPLGLEVQSAYATLAMGSSRVPVVLRNNTKDWLEIKKGTPIARMVAANLVPRVINAVSAKGPHPVSTLTEAERQDLLLDKLDLSGLDTWPTEQAEKARGLLKEYHNIFFLEQQDMGHTKAAEHKIVLKDPDTPPFKERFRRIPPPQLDKVREHLKLMLDAGVIRPSNSPWCNAVVLVRKKDGSLHFCIDFRKLNSLTVKDSHPLPRICETLASLAGAAHYSMFDMNTGFWQVPMSPESKQYTAFTLGSMGLYECESMPFGLCNAPPTFQRLMQNCLGELNLTYCLIYLDDVIVFSHTKEEHLERMRVIFDRLWEHGLKLKLQTA